MQQLWVVWVSHQALCHSCHGLGIVDHATQHLDPLASGRDPGRQALQLSALFECRTGCGPDVMHLGDQGANHPNVCAVRKVLNRFVRQHIGIGQPVLADQVGNGLSDFGGLSSFVALVSSDQ